MKLLRRVGKVPVIKDYQEVSSNSNSRMILI